MVIPIVAIGWIFVVVLMAAAEALSPQGSLLGAFFTLLLYGVLPLSVLLYILGTPARRALRRHQDASAQEATAQPGAAPASAAQDDTARHG